MTLTHSDIDHLIELNNQKKTQQPEKLISKFVVRDRIMPPGTPFPGPIDMSLTPYAVEWIDNMSPYSIIQRQVIEKAAQVAATWAVECIEGYWMKEYPTAILHMSATDKLLEKWGTKRLEPMIDSMGIREKIIQFAEGQFGKKSRRTGDKVFSKLFIGGFLEMASAQSPGSQRSDSIRLLIRDEIDGAPTQLVTGEGNWLDVSEARTKFWGDRKKITDLSTPTTRELSNIHPAYLEGDCRLYFVPCPMCGKVQTLYWLPESGNHGLRADTKAGIIKSIYYLCEFCHDAIFDTSKHEMFNSPDAKWKPTKNSWSDTYRSYNINSLYSPPGTVSWKNYYIKWMQARDDPEKMRGFTNLYGGQPYQEVGMRPKVQNIITLRGVYRSGQVPNETLWITGGGDVQRGKNEYAKLSEDDLEKVMAEMEAKKIDLHHQGLPRIELEILGHSYGYRTYSIEYKVFYGHTDDAYSGAWEKLCRWIESNELIYHRIDGSKIACSMVFMDSGDGARTATVYQFCEPYPGILPIKGDQVLKKKKEEKGDELMASSFKRYTISKIGEAQNMVTIATNHYKGKIYQRLNISRQPTEEQRPGFMEFPCDYPDYYFKMLSAEEKHLDGSFHAGGRRNEALDCRVYAICAGDVWLDMQVNKIREAYVKQGATREQVRKLYMHKHHIERLKRKRWVEMGKAE